MNLLRTFVSSIPLLMVSPPATALAGPGGSDCSVDLGTVSLSTGVTLEVATRAKCKGKGKGKAVIFLHGYTDSWFSWSGVLEELPPKYTGYALSQRGHGDSDRPAAGYEVDDFADDVIAFMDHEGLNKATIVGHSMGSVIAQRVAIDHPNRVKNLVLVGSVADAGNPVITGFLAFVLAEVADPIDPAFVLDFQAGTLATPVPADFLDTVVAESLKVPAFVWHAALAGLAAEDTTAELSQIDAPTLIVWGDQDTIFSEAEQQVLDAGIPDSTLTVYEGIGHGVHWEEPERFTDDLVDFIH